MAEFAENALGLRVLRGRLDEVDLGSEAWDVVTFTDSLEYVPDPVAPSARSSRVSPRAVSSS
jgi:hypothetical protein